MSILNASQTGSQSGPGNFGNEMMGSLNPVRNFDEAKAGVGRQVDKGKSKVLSSIVKRFVKGKKASK